MIVLLLLLALSPAERDRASLGRYLSPSEVAAAVASLAELLAPCGAGQDDGGWPLSFALSGAGRTLSVAVADAPDQLAECVEAALSAASLPVHDEEPLSVRTTLVVRGGVAAPGPVVDVDTRTVTTLFLALPPDLGATGLSALERALGLAPGAPQEVQR